jgi:hypothetical protein
MMARADVMKIVEDSHPRKCPAMEIGINNSRLERIVFVFSIEISERFPTANHINSGCTVSVIAFLR